MTKKDPIRLGNQAAELLKNPAFMAAIEGVRAVYTQRMIATTAEQQAERDNFHRCIHASHDLEAALTAFVEHGKMQKMMTIKKEKAKR